MPPDDDTRALLALIETWDAPAPGDDTYEQVRAFTREHWSMLGEPGESVARVEELRVPSADGDVGVRAYWPHADGPLPALVMLHGGGWFQGSLDHCDGLCRGLANGAGCVVLSVDYRLAPEHPFPAALEDAYAVLAWAVAQAGELGVDPARVGVCGESAGGNLAAALTLMAAQRRGPAVACQALLCPALDASMSQPSVGMLREQGNMVDAEQLAWAWSRYRGEAPADDPLVSPLAATLDMPLPPTTSVVAEADALRDEGIAYAAKLAAAGTDVRLRCWAGQLHCFFLCTARLPLAATAVAEIARDVGELLAGARR